MGAQSQAVFILFMTPQALAAFEASKGWTVGADSGELLARCLTAPGAGDYAAGAVRAADFAPSRHGL